VAKLVAGSDCLPTLALFDDPWGIAARHLSSFERPGSLGICRGVSHGHEFSPAAC